MKVNKLTKEDSARMEMNDTIRSGDYIHIKSSSTEKKDDVDLSIEHMVGIIGGKR